MEITRYTIEFLLPEGGHLPKFKSRMLTRLISRSYKKLVCISNKSQCVDCEFASDCSFPFLFYPAERSGIIISPWADLRTTYNKGDSLTCDITMIGNAAEWLPLIILAIQSKQYFYYNNYKIPYVFLKMWAHSWDGQKEVLMVNHYDITPINHLSIATSVNKLAQHLSKVYKSDHAHISFDGWIVEYGIHVDLLVEGGQKLLKTAIARYSLLLERYGENSEEEKKLIEDASKSLSSISISNQHIRYKPIKKSRRKSPLSKISGSFSLKGEGLAVGLAWLKMADWIHIGIHANFGSSRIQILND